MEVREVIFHHKKEICKKLKHEAVALIEGLTDEEKFKAAHEVAVLAGYHPSDYGIGNVHFENRGTPTKFSVSWESMHTAEG